MKMRRTISACISLFMIFLPAFSQFTTESSTWDNSDLKGRIKSVTESNYIIQNNGKKNFSDQDIVIQDEMIKNFDRNGMLIDQSLISYVGGESKKWNFTYDMQKQLVEEAVYNNSGLDETVSYFYSGNKVVKKNFFKGADKIYQKSWFYEYVLGKLVNEYWTDAQGKVNWRAVYTYDQAGNMVEKVWYVDERQTSKWVSKYDLQGNITYSAEFVNGLIQNSEFYDYDNNGRLSELKAFKNNQLDVRKVYEYNKDGDLRMEWWYDESGKQIHRRNYDYDKAHRMISTFTWNSKSELLDKTYWTYDSNGNWYQRIDYDKHTPVFTVKRTINYY